MHTFSAKAAVAAAGEELWQEDEQRRFNAYFEGRDAVLQRFKPGVETVHLVSHAYVYSLAVLCPLLHANRKHKSLDAFARCLLETLAAGHGCHRCFQAAVGIPCTSSRGTAAASGLPWSRSCTG